MGDLHLLREDSAATLAADRDLAAWHEAGHAVAHVHADLSFQGAKIWADPSRRGWNGEVTPVDGGCWVLDEQLPAFAVMVLAGPETEARRIHQTSGQRFSLSDIRAEVERDQDYPGGDFDMLPELLALAGITRAEADRLTAHAVTAWWPQIACVAGILLAKRSMSSAEIRAVVQAHADSLADVA